MVETIEPSNRVSFMSFTHLIAVRAISIRRREFFSVANYTPSLLPRCVCFFFFREARISGVMGRLDGGVGYRSRPPPHPTLKQRANVHTGPSGLGNHLIQS